MARPRECPTKVKPCVVRVYLSSGQMEKIENDAKREGNGKLSAWLRYLATNHKPKGGE